MQVRRLLIPLALVAAVVAAALIASAPHTRVPVSKQVPARALLSHAR